MDLCGAAASGQKYPNWGIAGDNKVGDICSQNYNQID